MPIYEYECQKCERRTEAIQRIGEKPLQICPHCGGKLKKLASAPAIQFKGSGWYVTDYARAKKEEKGSSHAEKAESSEKSAEKTSEKAAEKPTEKKKEKTAKE
ncbi:MAG TPA: FmdB family zinc ribbon protein [Thermoanaerobaculia bacterium]